MGVCASISDFGYVNVFWLTACDMGDTSHLPSLLGRCDHACLLHGFADMPIVQLTDLDTHLCYHLLRVTLCPGCAFW